MNIDLELDVTIRSKISGTSSQLRNPDSELLGNVALFVVAMVWLAS